MILNIGSKYSDLKMYKGVRHYDKVPLFGEDLNEAADIQSNKMSRVVQSLLGSGVLNTVTPSITSEGLTLPEPLAVNIEGDVCILKNSDDVPLLEHGILDRGFVYIVGWYQHLVSSTTLREYGGVNNLEIENELSKNEFNIQSTSRYQFRWDVYSSADELFLNSMFSMPARDENGNLLGSTYEFSLKSKSGNIFVSDIPAGMDYAIDQIYVLPIIKFSGSGGTITSAESLSKIAISFNYRLEDIYLEDIATSNMDTVSNIPIKLDIYNLNESDIIRLTYEGLELCQDSDYTVDYENRVVTLLGFTRRLGERLKINITRLVEY